MPSRLSLLLLVGVLTLIVAPVHASAANPGSAGSSVEPGTSAYSARAAPVGAARAGDGLWVGYSDGTVLAVAAAKDHGNAARLRLNAPVVSLAATPSGGGYWLLGRDGGVFSYGDAGFHGSTGGMRLNQAVVSMAAHPSGRGYWTVASDGGVFSFGVAFHGSAGNLPLNRPVVGMAPTTSGRGYWLVASDGGIFSYGDAAFSGSTGDLRLNQPIVAMAADPDGGGYWFVASDGGVFAFDAAFHGSAAGRLAPGDRVVGLVPHASGGYWLVTARGGVLGYGAAAAGVVTAPSPPLPAGGGGGSVPSEDLVLHVDFDRASRRPGFGDSRGMRAVWNELAPGYLARSYGEHNTRLVEADGETVMEARFSKGGASEYVGFRLGEDARRLDLGHHAWLSYYIWYDPRAPKDQSGKQPGLAAGYDFPSGGSSSYESGETDVNWKGASGRLGPYASPSNVGGLWWRMYAYPYQPDRVEWPRGAGPVQGGEHWIAKKPGTDVRSNNPESDRYVFPTGRWVHVVQELVMNTGLNTKDAEARLYVDGQLVMERAGGFRWYGPQMYPEVIQSMSDPARGFDGFYLSAGYNRDTPYHVVRYRDFKLGRTAEAVGLAAGGVPTAALARSMQYR